MSLKKKINRVKSIRRERKHTFEPGEPTDSIPRSRRLGYLKNMLYCGSWEKDSELLRKRNEFDCLKQALLSLKGVQCYCCSNDARHRHHVVPLCRRGKNSVTNLVGLCVPCHKKMDVILQNPYFRLMRKKRKVAIVLGKVADRVSKKEALTFTQGSLSSVEKVMFVPQVCTV